VQATRNKRREGFHKKGEGMKRGFRPNVLVMFIFLSVILTSCGSSSGGGSAGDTTAPSVSKSTPGNGSVMASDDKIVIIFNESMDTTSATLGGDLAAESDGGTWSTATKSAVGSLSKISAVNDLLTIGPQTTWSTGKDRTLTVDAKDVSGNALPTFKLILTIAQGVVYISPTGDDANDGSKEHPKATIQAGIAEAVNQGFDPGWICGRLD
jgi:hypothetical protein